MPYVNGQWVDDGQPNFSWVENNVEPLRITVNKVPPAYVDTTPTPLQNPDASPADIAAYRTINSVKRPGLLPIASTPEGAKLVMPKLLDLASNVISGGVASKVPLKAGEMALGSGAMRVSQEPERIISAATKINGKMYDLPTHLQAIEADAKARGMNVDDWANHKNFSIDFDGFKTNTGRYVSREEANEIANKSGQLKDKTADKFSTDATNINMEAKKAEPFFSSLERAVDNAKVEKADATTWLGYLKNQPGVKSEELAYTLKELPNGQISKSQIQDLVKQNKVELKEKVLGEKVDPLEVLKLNKREQELIAKGKNATKAEKQEWAYIKNKINSMYNDEKTQYHQYQLSGAEPNSYKETLLKFPDKLLSKEESAEKYYRSFIRKGGEPEFKDLPQAEKDRITDQVKDYMLMAKPEYTAPHFGNEGTNLFAHMRTNERKLGNQLGTHIDELQSDLHQAGRDFGYKGEKAKLEPEFNKVEKKIVDSNDEAVMGQPDIKDALKLAVEKGIINKEEAQVYERYSKVEAGEAAGKTVPDLPFKKNWDEILLKKAIRNAAEKGHDFISWTPGEAQALRYQNEIRQKINTVEWHNNISDGNKDWKRVFIKPTSGGELSLTVDKAGKIIGGHKDLKGKTLDEALGKDLAKQILEKGEGNIDAKGYVMGAEGMKAFYDKMLIDRANAIGKKYGSKVEQKFISPDREYYIGEETLPVGKTEKRKVYDIRWKEKNGDERFNASYPTKAEAEKRLAELQADKGQPIHYMPLTPELKKKALTEGFPLFSSGPNLIPVDHTPEFEDKKKYKLVPIEGNPFQ